MRLMAINISNHYVNKFNISRRHKIITGNNVPATMTIVAFAAFPYVNCRFNFQSNIFTGIIFFIDEIRIFLVMVMFIW